MKILKVYTDFTEDMELLGDAERGRLFTAMLQYASTGTVPDLKGNEKFVWGTVKKNIDSQREHYEEMCKTNKRIATERNESLRSVKKNNAPSEEQEQEQDKEQDIIPPYNPPKGKVDVFADFCGDDISLLEALRSFDEMRKKIRKPMTDNARQLLLKKLQKQPYAEWVEILEQSTLNGWQDIYPLKKETHSSGNKTADMLQKSYKMMEDWANGKK